MSRYSQAARCTTAWRANLFSKWNTKTVLFSGHISELFLSCFRYLSLRPRQLGMTAVSALGGGGRAAASVGIVAASGWPRAATGTHGSAAAEGTQARGHAPLFCPTQHFLPICWCDRETITDRIGRIARDSHGADRRLGYDRLGLCDCCGGGQRGALHAAP